MKKRFAALALSACMVMSAFPVFGQETENTAEEQTADHSEDSGEEIEVEANETGIYTVTITEDNLIYDENLAEDSPWIVSAGEAAAVDRNARSFSDFEDGDDDFDMIMPDDEEGYFPEDEGDGIESSGEDTSDQGAAFFEEDAGESGINEDAVKDAIGAETDLLQQLPIYQRQRTAEREDR